MISNYIHVVSIWFPSCLSDYRSGASLSSEMGSTEFYRDSKQLIVQDVGRPNGYSCET